MVLVQGFSPNTNSWSIIACLWTPDRELDILKAAAQTGYVGVRAVNYGVTKYYHFFRTDDDNQVVPLLVSEAEWFHHHPTSRGDNTRVHSARMNTSGPPPRPADLAAAPMAQLQPVVRPAAAAAAATEQAQPDVRPRQPVDDRKRSASPDNVDDESSFEKSLTCAICNDLFKNATLLMCGHTFCRDCLRECIRHDQRCPECRTPTGLEDDADIEENTRRNYAIDSVINVFRKRKVSRVEKIEFPDVDALIADLAKRLIQNSHHFYLHGSDILPPDSIQTILRELAQISQTFPRHPKIEAIQRALSVDYTHREPRTEEEACITSIQQTIDNKNMIQKKSQLFARILLRHLVLNRIESKINHDVFGAETLQFISDSVHEKILRDLMTSSLPPAGKQLRASNRSLLRQFCTSLESYNRQQRTPVVLDRHRKAVAAAHQSIRQYHYARSTIKFQEMSFDTGAIGQAADKAESATDNTHRQHSIDIERQGIAFSAATRSREMARNDPAWAARAQYDNAIHDYIQHRAGGFMEVDFYFHRMLKAAIQTDWEYVDLRDITSTVPFLAPTGPILPPYTTIDAGRLRLEESDRRMDIQQRDIRHFMQNARRIHGQIEDPMMDAAINLAQMIRTARERELDVSAGDTFGSQEY